LSEAKQGGSMRRSRLVPLILFLVLLVAACGGETTGPDTSSGGGGDTSSGGGEGDLLAKVQQRGKLIASTDPAYPPQSSLNAQDEYEGFDIDVTEEIAKRLGVDVDYTTPDFDAITAGGWGGRWDISVGSITITPERSKALLFTEPYYYTPASAAVHESNTDIQDPETDLDGKTIGVCVECSYQNFLEKDLKIPGETFDFVVDDADIKTYKTDTIAIQDLAIGDGVRLDAVLSALPTLEGAIDDGVPIKIVGDPLFYEPLGVAVDKNSPADPRSFYEKINQIVKDMHEDGTLTEFSKKWYDGEDLTKKV
jgi:polar amino acid transport system substrate-binding protein